MSEPPGIPPLLPEARPPSPERALRRLFLTLFLRGRTSRGLQRDKAPKSIGSKLGLMLGIYAFIGMMMALGFMNKPVFALSLYLHSMTLVFLGMFIAASAGEVLFNKDEADILMHRPVTARALLWAKISVLVQVSLWLAGAFNLGGFFVGAFGTNAGWLFLIVHAISTMCQALFCTGCIVMIYQLCLRWFGREKMEGLMTTAQVLVAVGAVMMGQIGPQLVARSGLKMEALDAWWIDLLPPAWFAGMDDALTGSGGRNSWLLAGIGLVCTTTVLGLAFGKLARNYETGLQSLNEASAAPRSRGGRRRWIDVLVKMPPLCWWLRDSIARASFLLTAAYLMRDRDVKLRMYPGIAPMLVMPIIFLLQENNRRHGMNADVPGAMDGFSVAFAGAYMGLIPLMALNLIRYSQQWQAGDLFRVAPMPGPAPLCHGARRAILCILTFPMLIVFGVLVLLLGHGSSHLPLLIPGLIALPIYALVPCIGGKAVPLSLPTEEAKSAGRGLSMIGVMVISAFIALAATLSWSHGLFGWFLGIEIIVAVAIYAVIRVSLTKTRWSPID